MTIQVAEIAGDIVELVFSPREEDLRVGEILSIVDRHQPRGLIVQILEIGTGPKPPPSIATPPSRRDRQSQIASARRRSPRASNATPSTRSDDYRAIAKIRQLTTPAWQAWDGWIPSPDTVITRTPEREVLHHCLQRGETPVALGKTLGNERLAIGVRDLAGVSLITGDDNAAGSRLATVILRELVAQGHPCVAFDICRPSCFLARHHHLDQAHELSGPEITRLRAGDDLKLDLHQCGPAPLLTWLTKYGLPKLPALYFVSHVAHRLADSLSAREVTQTPPFLGIEELLRLAYDLEAIGNKVLLGAILSCLWLIKQEGLLAATAAETTPFRDRYERICRGGALILDLAALNDPARGAMVRAVFDMLMSRRAAVRTDGPARPPCLILEEPHLYLDPQELSEILMRASAFQMISLVVTTHLTGIEPTLLRRIDNLLLLRHGCADDVRALATSGLLDHDTLMALSCRLGAHRGLLVGKATRRFPVLFVIDASDDRPEALQEAVTCATPAELASPPSGIMLISPAHGTHDEPRIDATLPLFPEEALSSSTPSPLLPYEKQEQVSPRSASVMSLTQITAKWEQIVRRVARRRRLLETILSTARPIHLAGHSLLLGFPPQSRFQQELMASPEYRTLLEEEISSLFGVPIEVTATLHPLPE
jgi:hypothetical protein